jgi:serine/threonine protein phosphatase PrpC
LQIRPGVELASLTDVGCQRQNNEDRCGYWEAASDQQFERSGRLAIVADGMGGYEGGQEASRIAVETIEELYSEESSDDPQSVLVSSMQAAHRRILDYADQHPQNRGMGTTCTAISIVGDRLFFAHVGDSRLYRLRGDHLSRLSRDHSYVSRLVESGAITAGQAESHPQRHILTAALGAGQDVTPDVPQEPVRLASDDRVLLCTDGLWSMVSDDELQQTIAAAAPLAACHSLVEMAKKRGGPDNITLLILRLL